MAIEQNSLRERMRSLVKENSPGQSLLPDTQDDQDLRDRMKSLASTPPAELNSSISSAVDRNPQEVATVEQNARKVGVPPSLNKDLQSAINKRAETDRIASLIKDRPALRQLYMNHGFASKAHPDTEALSRLDDHAQAVRKGLTAFGVLGAWAGDKMDSAAKAIGLNLPNLEFDGVDENGNPQYKVLEETDENRDLVRVAKAYNKIQEDPRLPEFMRSVNEAFKGGFWSGMAEASDRLIDDPSILSVLFAEEIPAMAVGGPAAGAVGNAIAKKLITDRVTNLVAKKYLERAIPLATVQFATNWPQTFAPEFAGAIEQGMSVDQAEGRALTKATVESGVNSLFSFVPGIDTGTKLRRFADTGIETFKQGVAGATGAGAASLAVGEEIDPAELVLEFFGEGTGAPIDLAMVALTRTGTSAEEQIRAMKLIRDSIQAKGAEQTAEQIAQFDEIVESIGLRDLDEETFNQAAKAISESAGLETIYLDADGLVNSLSEEQIAILEDRAPELMEEIRNSTELGTIEVPIATYLSKIAGTELSETVVNHASLEAGAMTKAEAEQFKAEQEAEFQQAQADVEEEIGRDEQLKSEVNFIETEITRQLEKTGRFRDSVTKDQAKFMANMFAVYSKSAGMTPKEMYETFTPKFTSGEKATQQKPQPKVMNLTPAQAQAFNNMTPEAQKEFEARARKQGFDTINVLQPEVAETILETEGDQEFSQSELTPDQMGFIGVEDITDEQEIEAALELLSRLTDQPVDQADGDLGRTVAGTEADESSLSSTVVTTEAGLPALVYRGARRQLTPEKFERSALGKNTGYAASGLGVWHTTNPAEAANYGPVVEPFYINITNPKMFIGGDSTKDLPQFDTIDEYYDYREQLRAEGYDGIVIDLRSVGEGMHVVTFDPEQNIRPSRPEPEQEPVIPEVLLDLLGDEELGLDVAQVLEDMDNAERIQSNGVDPDADSATGPMFDEFNQVQNLPEWKIKTIAWMEANGRSQEEIDRHMASIEAQTKIFEHLGPHQIEMLPQGGNLNPAPKRGKKVGQGGPIRTNADPIYKITFDASAMCVKRLEASATAAKVQAELGRALTASERMALVALFKSEGKTAPCVYCYVEAPRNKSGEFVANGVDVMFNKKPPKASWSDKIKTKLRDAQDELAELGLKPDDIDVNALLDADYAETADAKANLAQAPKVYDFLKNIMLAAKANLPKVYEEYEGQILDLDQGLLDELNNYAGLRFFSSSDFQAEHVADLMQAVFDMEVRGAKAHVYTKVPEFVEIFGATGMKVQTSVFAKRGPNGEIEMDDWQGMDWDQAKQYRKDHPDVGSIIVASDDDIVRWALDQDWIDYIIPFHYSGLESRFYGEMDWQDFTSTQSEKSLNPNKKAEKIRMHEVTKGDGIPNEEATRRYLTLAMERELVPVFPAFMFKDFKVAERTGDEKKDKKVRSEMNRAAVRRWEEMVSAGEIDWSQINMNYFKLRKDYARSDTPFNEVTANINVEKADQVLQSYLRGEEPGAVPDQEIGDALKRLIAKSEVQGTDVGVEALRAVKNRHSLMEKSREIPVEVEFGQGPIQGQPGSATTQVATTGGTYEKAAKIVEKLKPDAVRVLDYGAGLGLGSDSMRGILGDKVDSLEPFPERWRSDTPVTYTSSSEVQDKYDAIVNMNVLNVLEPNIRDRVILDIASLLSTDGVAVVGVRKWQGDVNSAKKATPGDEPKSLWIDKSTKSNPNNLVYQKGFDGNELVEYIENVLPEGFEVKRLNGVAANAVTIRKVSDVEFPQSAFHGTPHTFDRFSLEAIGTGEGAQAYGWGLYFAGDRAVAEWYQRKLAETPRAQTIQYKGEPLLSNGNNYITSSITNIAVGVQLGDTFEQSVEDEIQSIRMDETRAEFDPNYVFDPEAAHAALEALRTLSEDDITVDGSGNLFEVDIPEDSELLDWDKPLGEQSPTVKKGLRSIREGLAGSDPYSHEILDNAMLDGSGERIYRALAMITGHSDRGASLLLNANGIPGLRYADGNTRSGDQDSHNYVIWDEDVVTVEAVNDEKRQAEMAQRDQQNRSANRGGFRPNDLTIVLKRGADLSTFHHEAAHFFLEVLSRLDKDPNATPEIRKDMDSLLKWFGVTRKEWQGMSQEERRIHHEQFAHNFEVYLFENKAPNPEMRDLFRRFADWVRQVYRQSIGVIRQSFKETYGQDLKEIDPEVAAVYDRMVASEDQIRQFEGLQNMEPSEGTDKAIEELQARSLRDMRWLTGAKNRVLKKLQKEAAEKRKAMTRKVTDEIKAEPVYAAMEFLKYGRFESADEQIEVTQGHKLSIEAVKELYGPDGLVEPPNWKALGTGKYGMLAKEGLDPDMVAQMFGFSSGDDMIRSILEATPLKERVEAEVDTRMIEEHGDLTDPAAIERAADEAIHNEARARFIAGQLAGMKKAVGKTREIMRMAKEHAAQVISRTQVKDIKPSVYERAEAKALSAADTAQRKGEDREAVKYKRLQLLNNQLAKQALEARSEVDKIVSYLKKFQKSAVRKRMRGDALEQIDALLARFDLSRSRTLKEINAREKTLQQWVDDFSENNSLVKPDIEEVFYNEGYGRSYKLLTMGELRGLNDTVKQLEFLARREDKMYQAVKDQTFSEERDAIVAELAGMDPDILDDEGNVKPYNPNEKSHVRTKREKLDEVKGGFKADMLNLESLIGIVTGGKVNALHTSIMGRLSAASDWKIERLQELGDFLKPYFDAYSVLERRAFGKKAIHIPEINNSMTREQILFVGLYYGSETGRQRLKDGHGWSDAQIEAIVGKLDKKDIDLMNAIWEMNDEMIFPDLKKVHERTTGHKLEKVEAVSFDTPHGKARGGYTPLVYDGDIDYTADKYDAAKSVQEMIGGGVFRAGTNTGSTKARAEKVNKQLVLGFEAMNKGMNDTLHDIAYREAIADTHRLVTTPSVMNAIKRIAGPKVAKAFEGRIRDVAAVPSDPGPWTGAAILSWMRKNTLMTMMGFSVKTALINLTGIFPATNRVGSARLLKHTLKTYLKNPISTYKTVLEQSAYMRNRNRDFDRDLAEQARRFTTKQKLTPDMATAMSMIAWVDRSVSIPVWMAAYEKAINGNAMDEDVPADNHEAAVAFADSVVRMTQGSGRDVDLAAVMSGKGLGAEFKKIFTMFYGYFSAQLGQFVRSKAKRKRQRAEGDVFAAAKRFSDIMGIVVVPAVASALLYGRIEGDGDDEWTEEDIVPVAKSMARETALYFGGFFPYFRDFVAAGMSVVDEDTKFYGYRLSPVQTIPENVIKGAEGVKDFARGEGDRVDVKRIILAIGAITGLPGGMQAARTVDHAMKVSEGESDFNPYYLIVGEPPK